MNQPGRWGEGRQVPDRPAPITPPPHYPPPAPRAPAPLRPGVQDAVHRPAAVLEVERGGGILRLAQGEIEAALQVAQGAERHRAEVGLRGAVADELPAHQLEVGALEVAAVEADHRPRLGEFAPDAGL